MKLTPITLNGDSRKVYDALCQMFVRAAQMARKRPSPIDIAIAPESVSLIVTMEQLFLEEKTVDEVVNQLNKMFLPLN